MRKLFLIIILISLSLASCTPHPDSTIVLTLKDMEGEILRSYTLTELKALPYVEGYGGYKLSTGRVEPPQLYRGVPLEALTTDLEGFNETAGLNLIATDGYAITISYNQLVNAAFIQYNPQSGEQLSTPVPIMTILAYERNGQALDADKDGFLRVMMVSDKPNQVVDGHWAVKFIDQIQLRFLNTDWLLQLEGALSETMDRATFESGASEHCHGIEWVDSHAQHWLGIPLWLLVGRVDDDNVHKDHAFNQALADAGYTVEVFSATGDSIILESSRITRNPNIIIAYQVSGNPLPDEYFPLRLVGADLLDEEMLGQVEKIVVHLDTASLQSLLTLR